MNLLIVDDETATRNGLLRHIDWSAYGIEKIELASSGGEALERCTLFRPDIILSDIHMPEMSGIELCEKIKARYPECVILFLSGYSDKEYLHSAIDLGAVDYVEKPIDIEELTRAVRKAADRARRLKMDNQSMGSMHQMLSRSMPIIRQKAIKTLISSGISDEQCLSDLKLLDVFSDLSHWFLVLLIRYPRPLSGLEAAEKAFSDQMAAFLNHYEYLQSFLDPSWQILILSSPSPAQLPHRGHNRELDVFISRLRLEDMPGFCAVGRPVHGADAVAASFHEAELAGENLFFQDYGTIAFYGKGFTADPVFPEDSLNRFSQALQNEHGNEAMAVLDSLYAAFSRQTQVHPDQIRAVYRKLIRLIDERRQQLYQAASSSSGDGAFSVDSATLKELDRYCRDQVTALFYDARTGKDRRIIIQVTHYIQEHYWDSRLSVKEISKAVYLTPNYLSNLFKKETGGSLVEYIRTTRIKNSLPLLADDSLKLYHIALRVGFMDANYYAKMFKKIMGITPSEYKERNR